MAVGKFDAESAAYAGRPELMWQSSTKSKIELRQRLQFMEAPSVFGVALAVRNRCSITLWSARIVADQILKYSNTIM